MPTVSQRKITDVFIFYILYKEVLYIYIKYIVCVCIYHRIRDPTVVPEGLP